MMKKHPSKTVTGWVREGKALVTIANPNGDKIIFRRGRRLRTKPPSPRTTRRRTGRLRLTTACTICSLVSPLAAEALYRAADIRWQMERSDVMTRPLLAKEMRISEAPSTKSG